LKTKQLKKLKRLFIQTLSKPWTNWAGTRPVSNTIVQDESGLKTILKQTVHLS